MELSDLGFDEARGERVCQEEDGENVGWSTPIRNRDLMKTSESVN